MNCQEIKNEKCTNCSDKMLCRTFLGLKELDEYDSDGCLVVQLADQYKKVMKASAGIHEQIQYIVTKNNVIGNKTKEAEKYISGKTDIISNAKEYYYTMAHIVKNLDEVYFPFYIDSMNKLRDIFDIRKQEKEGYKRIQIVESI